MIGINLFFFFKSTKQLLSTFQHLLKITFHQSSEIHTQCYFTIKAENLIHVPLHTEISYYFPAFSDQEKVDASGD